MYLRKDYSKNVLEQVLWDPQLRSTERRMLLFGSLPLFESKRQFHPHLGWLPSFNKLSWKNPLTPPQSCFHNYLKSSEINNELVLAALLLLSWHPLIITLNHNFLSWTHKVSLQVHDDKCIYSFLNVPII